MLDPVPSTTWYDRPATVTTSLVEACVPSGNSGSTRGSGRNLIAGRGCRRSQAYKTNAPIVTPTMNMSAPRTPSRTAISRGSNVLPPAALCGERLVVPQEALEVVAPYERAAGLLGDLP